MASCSVETLKSAQKSLGYCAADMAIALQTPLRTYQDWLAGKNRIPGVVAVAVEGLVNKDGWWADRVRWQRELDLDTRFPNGIR